MATTFKTSSTNISQNCFVECSFFRNFDFVELTLHSGMKIKKLFFCISLVFS